MNDQKAIVGPSLDASDLGGEAPYVVQHISSITNKPAYFFRETQAYLGCALSQATRFESVEEACSAWAKLVLLRGDRMMVKQCRIISVAALRAEAESRKQKYEVTLFGVGPVRASVEMKAESREEAEELVTEISDSTLLEQSKCLAWKSDGIPYLYNIDSIELLDE